ncbi:unnamed protein product [Didymodactylos carnosus]|uniref:Integrase catalytic domain-containing protein n=1 Tax=Didymodactylos carnosus TaxID=1234261 RepID=A0A815HAR9_9BILA|nr:unnamed protein product [Didymodactylos carnosus]CAF1349027.1 unnamed protein product [Didymodactylos carnosus]CAF3695648.1 unnamed protein product [Didymodactylos carnosus]CAF4217278.1 unnamed protein product [Didymodactylos carnosus]
MKTKEAQNVALIFQSIFYQFGPPRILQSDNGREFTAKVILDLKKTWPELVIVNGRPRHPQSQGLIERENAVVQQMLGKWIDTNKTRNWVGGLAPRSDEEFWRNIQQQKIIINDDDTDANGEQRIILEEELPNETRLLLDDFDRKADDVQQNNILDNNQQEDAYKGQETLFVNANTTQGVIQNGDLENLFGDDVVDVHTDNQLNINQNDENLLNWLNSITDKNSNVGDKSSNDNAQSVTINQTVPSDIVPDTASLEPAINNRHKRIRYEGEQHYLATAEKQLHKYNTSINKRRTSYQLDDIVGIKISEVDRTNTSSTILPCKITNVCQRGDCGMQLYEVVTIYGLIKDLYQSEVFYDLSSSSFAELRALNVVNLPRITFIQACQFYTDFRSFETCKCAGTCDTNRCPCKKRKTLCCTKCHKGKTSQCKNC